MKKGLRVAGIVALAIAVAHCGDSDVRVSTGPGVVPSPGTFTGTLSDGGSLRIEVGSIEEIEFDCDEVVIRETFSPPRQIERDGSFSIGFSEGRRQFRVRGTFRDDNTVDGTIDDEDNECDVSYEAFRGGAGHTPTPVVTPTGVVVVPTATSGEPIPTNDPTFTPGGGVLTPTTTPTPTDGEACPVAVEVEGNGGSNPVLDSGWTGLAHNATVVSDGKLTFTVSNCSSPVRPCGQCQVGGPIQNLAADEGDINAQRCSTDSSTKCTGTADCGGSPCVFYFGSPLPLTAGGVSSCVVNQVNGAVSGTANVETGVFATTINLTTRVALGDTDHPCPTCEGDPTPNDGTAGGTCDGGARNGLGCDANGTTATPFFATTSLDCPPASFISALSIALAGSSGTETRTLSQSSDGCAGAPGRKCFCPFSAGQPTQPNSCLDNTLTPEDGSLCVQVGSNPNKGVCPDNADGACLPSEPYRPCLINSECQGSDTCVFDNRACFLDNGLVGGSVSAVGMADAPDNNGRSDPTFAALFCIPHTGSAAINSAGGLPGLGRVELPLISQEILTLP